MLPERLPYDTLDVVTRCRFAAVFLGNRKPQAGAVQLVAAVQHRKPFVTAALRLFEHAAEGGRVEEPVVAAKPVVS